MQTNEITLTVVGERREEQFNQVVTFFFDGGCCAVLVCKGKDLVEESVRKENNLDWLVRLIAHEAVDRSSNARTAR